MGGALTEVFLAGTILSCPGCGLGLYKVTARCTTEDLVMDDGTLLTQLEQTSRFVTTYAPPWHSQFPLRAGAEA